MLTTIEHHLTLVVTLIHYNFPFASYEHKPTRLGTSLR